MSAKSNPSFFESLAQASMLPLTHPHCHYGIDNVSMIQLPRPEKAHDALVIISNGLAKKSKINGAVTGI